MDKKPNSSFGKKAGDKGDFKGKAGRKGSDDRKPFKRSEGKRTDEKKPFERKKDNGKPFTRGNRSFEERPGKKYADDTSKFPERKRSGERTEKEAMGWREGKKEEKPFRERRRTAADDFKPVKRSRDKDKYADLKKTGAKKSSFVTPPSDQADKKKPAKKTDIFKDPKPRTDRRDPAALRPQQFDDKVYGELADEEKKVFRPGRTTRDTRRNAESKPEETAIDSAMPLNKYIAHSGECSRRDAAGFVKEGKVRVNGELVLEPGYRVKPGDQVTLSGKKLTPQKGLVYILLNKPKGFITTTEDPQERKTVMDLVDNAGVDRLYPVGRLDRNTTGLLLITNDGTLAHKLSHPSYNIRKVYQVTLDKNLTNADYQKIVKGLELEDGKVEVDEIAYLEHRNELGLEIHSGRNRIVRRIFESLGYEVEKLDRVMYAGLTKKNLPRGKWRFLNEKEIILLKHFKS